MFYSYAHYFQMKTPHETWLNITTFRRMFAEFMHILCPSVCSLVKCIYLFFPQNISSVPRSVSCLSVPGCWLNSTSLLCYSWTALSSTPSFSWCVCCGVMICGRREKSAKSESLDYYRSVFVNTIGGLLYSGDTNIWNKPLLITLLWEDYFLDAL